jgi:hypothetical protein
VQSIEHYSLAPLARKEMNETWNCPNCNEELGELNPWCEFCYYDYGTKVYNPDVTYVRDIRIYHLTRKAQPMTPGEELFAKFFKKHTDIMLVKNMTGLEIRKYIEEYSLVAAEARAAVYAGDTLLKDKEKNGKTQGFARDKNVDETTSNAINIIKTKRLSRKEQIQKQIDELYKAAGNPDAAKDAEAAVSARNMSGVVNRVQDTRKPNPFAKKVTREDEAIAAILSGDTAKLLVREQPKTEEKKPMYKNPFVKKDNK